MSGRSGTWSVVTRRRLEWGQVPPCTSLWKTESRPKIIWILCSLNLFRFVSFHFVPSSSILLCEPYYIIWSVCRWQQCIMESLFCIHRYYLVFDCCELFYTVRDLRRHDTTVLMMMLLVLIVVPVDIYCHCHNTTVHHNQIRNRDTL